MDSPQFHPKGWRPDEVLTQVADARRELETQQPGNAKNLIRKAPSVSVMFVNIEIGFMIEQTIDHMGSIAGRCTDHLNT